MVRVDEEVPHWESAAIRWRRCCGFSCRWSLILHAGTSDLSSFMFQHDDDPNTPSVKHTGDRHQSRTSASLKQSGTTQHECPSGSPENWRSSETESSSELTLSWRMKLLAPQIHLQAACFCPVCCICIYIYSIQIFLQNIKNWGVAEDCCTALYAHTHTHTEQKRWCLCSRWFKHGAVTSVFVLMWLRNAKYSHLSSQTREVS